MGIGSITDYGSLLSNYRIPQIPTVDAEQIRHQENSMPAEELTKSPAQEAVSDDSGRRQLLAPAKLEDISLSFNKGEDYSYLGSDSDIAALDMQKAISDMQKDQVLQQYQYFVGSAVNPSPEVPASDGKVIMKLIETPC